MIEKREVVAMAWSTSGMYETEFDRTTNMVLRTIQHIGVSDEEIEIDQQFLVDLFMVIGKSDDEEPPITFMAAMDCAFIGLLYHRHMPFKKDFDDSTLVRPPIEANDYLATMNLVINALTQQLTIPKALVDRAIQEGADRALEACRRPDTFESDDMALHRDLVALMIIGTLVHRLMPHTSTAPDQQ